MDVSTLMYIQAALNKFSIKKEEEKRREGREGKGRRERKRDIL